LKEYDLEDITKEWSTNLLISENLMDISKIDSPKLVHNTLGPSKTKEDE
jgi:hypothetical protein